MSQLLPMLEHVEFFRGPARDGSLADRLPELGRETATEIRRFSHAIPRDPFDLSISVRYTSGSISATRRRDKADGRKIIDLTAFDCASGTKVVITVTDCTHEWIVR